MPTNTPRLITFTEAKRAIYIDFECLATKPPQPALLGVLIGSSHEDFEQLIIDPRLAPAVVANKRLRVVDASATVRAIVHRAEKEHRTIVGWSFFDRNVAKATAPDCAASLDGLYRNAIQVTRPWRQAVHPAVSITRMDAFAPIHTLDRYAEIAGYADARRLKGAQPADWIRHTLRQLEATAGNYRRTTSETKRDWHKLLEYNRHDCLALCHVVLKATREGEAWRAYRRTRFCVDDGPRRICFMAGATNRRLDAVLERFRRKQWAFITAWNPGSIELTRAENEARQTRLESEVRRAGYEILPGEGVGKDKSWTPEKSILIIGISEDAAVRLGRAFDQLAIVVGRRGLPSRLVSCAGGPGALAR